MPGRRCGRLLMWRSAGRRSAGPLRLAGGRLSTMRRLLRPPIRADFALLRLRHHQRGGLCLRSEARHLHRRHGGRRK
jgi:hypothetical protein